MSKRSNHQSSALGLSMGTAEKKKPTLAKESRHKKHTYVSSPGESSSERSLTELATEESHEWAEAWLDNEVRTRVPDWHYDGRLRDVSVKMRAVLLDWLFEVVLEYRLSHKTLQLAANYVDRYLCAHPETRKGALQLVGITALLIASKFEDLRPVDLPALIWISDEAYTADQVLDMERKMLHTLGWELAAVPTVTFVENVIVDLELPAPDESHLRHFAVFLSHLCTQSWQCSQGMRPSQLAAVCVFYAGLTLGLISEWPQALTRQVRSQPSDPSIIRCLRTLHELFQALQALDLHRALRSKYSHFSLNSVALTPPLKKVPF